MTDIQVLQAPAESDLVMIDLGAVTEETEFLPVGLPDGLEGLNI